MSELNKYLTEDMLERIIDLYPKCYIIKYTEQVSIDNLYVGKVLFCNKTTKKDIKIEKNVLFPKQKIKYKTTPNDKYGTAVVNQYWVKPFINDPRIPINVKVYKSKVDSSGKRIYYEDEEKVKLTYNQYVKRMLVYDFRCYKHQIMLAYENFYQRYFKHKDYYLALNETSKHYYITHEMLKIIISRINNAKQKYKKNWKETYILFLENNIEQKIIDEITKENEDILDKVIYLENRK